MLGGSDKNNVLRAAAAAAEQTIYKYINSDDGQPISAARLYEIQLTLKGKIFNRHNMEYVERD